MPTRPNSNCPFDVLVYGSGLWDVEYGTAEEWVQALLEIADVVRPHVQRGGLYFLMMPSTNGGPSTVYDRVRTVCVHVCVGCWSLPLAIVD